MNEWIPTILLINKSKTELPTKGCTAFSITNLGTATLKVGDYPLEQNESIPFSGALNGVCAINVPIRFSEVGTQKALLTMTSPHTITSNC